jgi:hypothetical protein
MPNSETITGKGDGHTILYEFYVVLSWKGPPFHARMSLLEVYNNWRGDCLSFPVGSEAKTKDFPSRRRRTVCSFGSILGQRCRMLRTISLMRYRVCSWWVARLVSGSCSLRICVVAAACCMACPCFQDPLHLPEPDECHVFLYKRPRWYTVGC